MGDQNDSKAASNQESAQSPPPPPIPPQNETVLPEAEQHPPDNDAHVTTTVPTSTRPIEWLQLTVNGALAVIGVFAICIYGGQLKAMIESNKINHESLISVQRAFVTYEGMNLDTYPTSLQENQNAWVFTANLENSGTTPAISKIQEFLANNTLHAEPTELEFIGADENHPIGEMGPKAHAGMGPLVKNSAFIMGKYPFTAASIGNKEFQDFFHTERIFLWGWIGYRDVFPNTMPHVTEFCEEVQGIAARINIAAKSPSKAIQPNVLFIECADHNCTDEHCKDYQIIAAKVPK